MNNDKITPGKYTIKKEEVNNNFEENTPLCVNIFPVKPKETYSEEWSVMFASNQKKLCLMLINKEISGIDRAILDYLMAYMEIGNYCTINQKMLAEEIGIAAPNVSRSIKKLVEKGILLKEDKKNGRLNIYRINPEFAWKGAIKEGIKEKNHLKLVHSRD